MSDLADPRGAAQEAVRSLRRRAARLDDDGIDLILPARPSRSRRSVRPGAAPQQMMLFTSSQSKRDSLPSRARSSA